MKTVSLITLNDETQVDGTALLQQVLAVNEETEAFEEVETAAGPEAAGGFRSGYILPEFNTDTYSADPRISSVYRRLHDHPKLHIT